MKKLFYFVVVIAIAVVVSCAGGPGKQIIGTWKCEGVEISNLDEVINGMLAQVPDSMKEAQKKAMEDGMKQQMEAMKAISMNFKDDKTFETTGAGKTDKGTWAISEDGKTLTTKQGEADAAKEDKLSIDELTANKLVVSGDMGGTKLKMSFVK